MKIGLISDCHAATKPAEDDKYYSHSFVKFQDSCAYFLRAHVDFVVNLGDVYQSTGDPADSRAALTRMVFPRMMSRAPFIHVLGNHDVVDYTKQEFLEMQRDPAKLMNRPGSPGTRRRTIPQIEVTPADSSYYSFQREGWKFIVLDTNFDKDGNSYEKTAYKPEEAYINAPQLQWLKDELAEGLPAVIFTHGNLDVHESPLADICRLANAEEVRDVIDAAGNVKLVLQGHDHFGGFSEIKGVSYITMHATVLNRYYPSHCSCAVMEIKEDEIFIQGYEDQPSYTVSL